MSRFQKKALALILAGAMVMSGVPASAAGTGETEAAEEYLEDTTGGYLDEQSEATGSSETFSDETVEETAEVEELERAEETSEESETEETAEELERTEETSIDADAETSEVSETEETSADAETEETETDVDEEENQYSSTDAAFKDEDTTYAVWTYEGGTFASSKNSTTSIESAVGTYTNSAGDVLYIDAMGSYTYTSSGAEKTGNGKFGLSDADSYETYDRIQINQTTKIYIPVAVTDKTATVTIYQSGTSEQSSVVYDADDDSGYFAVSGVDVTVTAKCTELSGGGTSGEKTYYKAVITCTFTTEKTSAIVCVEAKQSNYATKIVSGTKTRDDLYDDSSVGDSAALTQYAMEGYANSYGVTGGGVMKTDSSNYYTVDTAEEFLQALVDIQSTAEPSVIRITHNLNLGCNEVSDFSSYSSVIKADSYQALWHPTLKKTGVSDLNLKGFSDLTIFSTNGSAIKHCGIILTQSENIIIRNIVFDELWEWDDGGTVADENATYEMGGYDRNDWDYLCVDDSSDGIWIDHCTFYKAYDGVIDVKKAKGEGEDERVTISWCKFEEKSAPSKDEDGNVTGYPFYDAQIEYLEKNIDDTTYYQSLRADTTDTVTYNYTEYTYNSDGSVASSTEKTTELSGEGYSKDDIITYTRGQKKTHLFGQSDSDTSAKGIRVTLANNVYTNSMDRLPRLRMGIVHEYNCILDSSVLYAAKTGTDGSKFDNHLVSNGAISTVGGYVFLENCYIDGIKNALLAGNGSSSPGYIGANDCLYYLNNESATLSVTVKNNTDETDYEIDKDNFTKQLPSGYGSYKLYDADTLSTNVTPNAGAGVLKMNPIRWTKTSYGDGTTTDDTDPTNWSADTDNDPAENDDTDYSIDDGDDDDGDGDGDSGDTVTNTFKFRASDLTSLMDDTDVGDYFTVLYLGNSLVSGTATIDGETFTKYVKFGGKGTTSTNSIKIKALGAGTATVYAASSKSGTARQIVLLDADGKTVETGDSVDSAAAVKLTIPEKGTYYVGSGDSGMYIYGIDLTVTYAEGETFDEEDEEVEETTVVTPEGDEVYDASDAESTDLVRYNLEGYAESANVGGGGLLTENSEYYYTASNEKEFLEALSEIRTGMINDKYANPYVLEITADELNLGNLELNEKYAEEEWNIAASGGTYSGVIRAYADSQQPLMSPTLKDTGVSYIKLNGFKNLTIFSKNGAAIKHAGIIFEGYCSNIIIRNLTFDELWEWDEETGDSGSYGSWDRNDWDYMTIEEGSEAIWIDHCTFYKAYDGVIDMKKGSDYQRVTISWCEFLPGSANDNEFFNEQMTWLENNKDSTTYYKSLRDTEGMSEEDVWWYAYGQKKTHLFGYSDSDNTDKAIRVTLANNYYKDSMDRLPRLRFGKAHEYNCILDAQDLYTKKTSGSSGLSSHITSNGAISTCGGEMLLENCYISGILHPLVSGNSSSPTGYINAVDSLYYMNGVLTTLEPENNNSSSYTGDKTVLVTDADAFIEALPYSDYVTYDASTLYEVVQPYAGAGKLDLRTAQWEATSYGSRTDNNLETAATPTADPASGSVVVGTSVTLSCETEGASIYYTTDESEPTTESTLYSEAIVLGTAGTVVIKAFAAMEGYNDSETATFTYTVVAESPQEPADDDDDEDNSGLTIQFVDGQTSYDYTGSAIQPGIKAYNNGVLLTPGDDYTVKYTNNVNVPTTTAANKQPTVTVTGKGNISGKTTANFTITAADIANATAADLRVVKGSTISAPVVYYNGAQLKLNKDFKYANGSQTSYTEDGTLTITGMGNFNSASTKEITVKVYADKAAMSAAAKKFTVAVDSSKTKNLQYTGESLEDSITDCLKITAKDGGAALGEGDYTVNFPANVTDAGTVKFTVVGLGDYSGCNVSKSVKILPRTVTVVTSNAGNSNVLLVNNSGGTAVYDSAGATQDLSLSYTYKDNDTLTPPPPLTAGKDYKVKYSGNKKVTTATTKAKYTITFMGNYKGSYKNGTFTITQADLTDAKVSAADKVAAEGKAAKSTPYVTLNGVTVKSSEYTVTYGGAADSKGKITSFGGESSVEVTVTITSKNKNYKNGTSGTYTVWKKGASGMTDLSQAKITVLGDDGKATTKVEYTGTPVSPSITVTVNNSTIKGDDVEKYFDVAYVNNVNKGKATVIVNAKAENTGGYIGGKTATFSIVAKSITDTEITWAELSTNAVDVINNGLLELLKEE